MTKYSVNLIRAFAGPRHERLEKLWQRFARANRQRMTLHVFDNLKSGLCHADALAALWRDEMARPQRYAIITEFDLLPDPECFLSLAYLGEGTPIVAAEYCTRDPISRRIVHHVIPGAWYMVLDKEQLPDLPPGAFGPAGRFNDPCNGLAAHVPHVALLPAGDCYPRHYGCAVGRRGEHLFWSRHYNDPPETLVAGFAMGDVHRGVDRAIEDYERREALHYV